MDSRLGCAEGLCIGSGPSKPSSSPRPVTSCFPRWPSGRFDAAHAPELSNLFFCGISDLSTIDSGSCGGEYERFRGRVKQSKTHSGQATLAEVIKELVAGSAGERHLFRNEVLIVENDVEK
jgi:hypothetical protein